MVSDEEWALQISETNPEESMALAWAQCKNTYFGNQNEKDP